jgi:hypothetical protein
MHLTGEVITALEKAAEEEEKTRQKGATRRDKTGRTPRTTRSVGSGDGCDDGVGSG